MFNPIDASDQLGIHDPAAILLKTATKATIILTTIISWPSKSSRLVQRKSQKLYSGCKATRDPLSLLSFLNPLSPPPFSLPQQCVN